MKKAWHSSQAVKFISVFILLHFILLLIGENFSVHFDSNPIRLVNLQARLYKKCHPPDREISNNDKKKNNILNGLHSNSRGKRIKQIFYWFWRILITAWCSFMEPYKSQKNNWRARVNLLPCPFWVSSLMTQPKCQETAVSHGWLCLIIYCFSH